VAYTVPKLNDFSEQTIRAAFVKVRHDLDEAIEALKNELDTLDEPDAKKAPSKADAKWKEFRDAWKARKTGVLTQIREQWLRVVPPQTKALVGSEFNRLQVKVDQAADQMEAYARDSVIWEGGVHGFAEGLKGLPEWKARKRIDLGLDITLPGNRRPLGAEHPIIKTMNEMVSVFRNLGYSIEEGPEIETDYYNFESLNFPPNHPARDTQDTLFIAGQESKPLRDRLLLRTHTSPVQIRTMEKMKPPVRVVCPGKVHRNDAPDATHSPIFHQIEGLAVDTNITFCDLKGTLDHAMKAFFGSSVKTRFYPSFFPFTEPSADVQISCIFCGGKGYRDGGRCPQCKASGWIELLGCGMVDPNVYGFVDYDPKKFSGFAFGMGVERIAILKYGVDDIQLFFQGDVRFLEQFG